MNLKFLFILFITFNMRVVTAQSFDVKNHFDTLFIDVKPIVFLSNDTMYRYFYIRSENLLLNKNQFNKYVSNESKVKYYSNGNTYFKELKISPTVDTIKSILGSNNDYIVDPKNQSDKNGLSILWYDLKAALLFKLFEENYSEDYIYLASTGKINRTDFKYYGHWFYTLIKVDLTQDSTCNFYFYTKLSNWKKSITMSDSISISKKKLDKIETNIESIAIYNGEFEPTSSNAIDFLYVKNERYIPETIFTPLNKEGTYSIGYIKKQARKYFDIPYLQKK